MQFLLPLLLFKNVSKCTTSFLGRKQHISDVCFPFFLTTLPSMWNFSSPTQDGIHSPFVGHAVLTKGSQGSPSALLFFHLTIYPRVPWPPQRWSSFLCTAAQNCIVWMHPALFSQSFADGLVGSTNIHCMAKSCQALEIKPWSLASGNSVSRGGELLQ